MNGRSYAQSYEGVQSFMYKVFGWMAYALTLTGATSYYVFSSEPLRKMILGNWAIVITLVLVQLGLVIALSAAIGRMSYGVAFTLFSLYSVITGMMLSSIFMMYTTSSIAMVFFITAGMFATMALYGAVTKADLTSMGSILFMVLIGVIIASIINLFIQSSMFHFVLAIISVIVFAGLTAFDVQKIKELAQRMDTEAEFAGNIAVLGALTLYLDFINLFLSLLTIMGERRDR